MRHKALKKKIAWWLYQENDLRSAKCLLASSPFEAECVEKVLPGSRIEVIPNGCDEGPEVASSEFGLADLNGSRWALALGRLHPVKGYAELIGAWARLCPEGWKLAIAGPDENGYRAELERMIR